MESLFIQFIYLWSWYPALLPRSSGWRTTSLWELEWRWLMKVTENISWLSGELMPSIPGPCISSASNIQNNDESNCKKFFLILNFKKASNFYNKYIMAMQSGILRFLTVWRSHFQPFSSDGILVRQGILQLWWGEGAHVPKALVTVSQLLWYILWP